MKKRPPKNAMSWRRRRKDREGATAVEFAIVANVMFVMVMTCMEFARLNMVRNLAQDAAYFAARKIIVFGACLLYTSPSPRDLSTSRMPSSA